jgi:dolichyl-phosphate-mannose--protein O-mannosyl transferase
VVVRSRLFLLGQPFVVVWIGFMIVSFAYALLLWALLTLSNFTIFPKETLIEVMIAAFLTTLMFPALSWVLHVIHKLLPMAYNPLRGAP